MSEHKNTESNLKRIKGIVFEGGGIAGIAHVGVLIKLQEWGLFNQITHFAGASAGAIIAGMLACKASLPYIEKKLSELDFKKFKDKSHDNTVGIKEII